MMRRDRARIARAVAALAACLVVAAPRPAGASTAVTWQHPPRPGAAGAPRDAREAAARDGERTENIAMGAAGTLGLSPTLRELFPGSSKLAPPPILWSAAVDPEGNLYAGAGNTGEIFRVDRKGSASTYFDSEELGARALAVDLSGDLYAATFPAGGIYRVRPGKEPEPWFEAEDRYFWGLAIDGAGRLYVATGERGIIYRVVDRARGETFFDSDEANITSIAADPNGFILAGTDPGGLLYRIAPDGKAEVLLDTELREISAITVTPAGVVYAAAMSEDVVQPVRKPGEKSDLTIEVTPAPDGGILEEPSDLPRKITIDLSELLPSIAGGVEGSAGRIYRVEPGRAPALVWKSDTERPYTLAWSRDRGLLFGTGGAGAEGRIYRLEADGSATALHRLREAQVTALVAAPDSRVYVCTSNPGRVYVMEGGTAPAGSYVSAVRDAGRPAQWGSISWDADVPPGTRLEISTRSGNRPDPDGSWSGWSPAYSSGKGSGITSPSARYLQWKADLSRLKADALPLLRSLKVTLLPQNTPPVLKDLAVLAAGAPAPAPAEAPGRSEKPAPEKGAEEKTAAAPTTPPKGSRWVTWTTSDPDGDAVNHSIWIRRAGEQTFRKVGDAIAASPFALQDDGLDEGTWEVKVEADDLTVNGPERGLTASSTSDPFIVDHTPPHLEIKPSSAAGGPPATAAGRPRVEVVATDALSPIARAEYSVLGDEAAGQSSKSWTPLPCRDGICDTATESFLADLPEPDGGRKATVRVYDAAGNAATIELPSSARKEGR